MASWKPTFHILHEGTKTIVGPFETREEALDYISWKRWWPLPRIIEGITTYNLTHEEVQDSLPGWERVYPEPMPCAFKRWRK